MDARRRGRGFTVDAQGAVERQSNSLIAPGSDGERAVPDDQTMGGGALTLGYEGRLFGMRLGLGVHEGYVDHLLPCSLDSTAGGSSCYRPGTYRSTLLFYPALTMRVGPAVGVHFEHVVGSYSIATTLRPGFHVGVGYTWPRGYEVMLHAGIQSSMAGDFLFDTQRRLALSGALPFTDRVLLGFGVAYLHGEVRDDFDGRASLTVRIRP